MIENFNNKHCKVFIWHRLFDSQILIVDKLQIIDDNKRIGFNICNQDIYMAKSDIKTFKIKENYVEFTSKNKKIKIVLKNA